MIAPSILSADFANLARDCKAVVEAGADWLHVDVMDGHFVPNITIGPCVLQSLKKAVPNAFYDCHLMVSDPTKWVDQFAQNGANLITFHVEAVPDVQQQLNLIHRIKQASVKAAVSIKPATQVDQLDQKVLDEVDMVLIMTVEPGFGGQKYMENCAEKCKELKRRRPGLLVEVDGGISDKTIAHAKSCGIDVFVAGSYVFSGDFKQKINSLK